MPAIRQTSFAAGELDPRLWGRTDLAEYGHGLRRCRNFFVSRTGAAVSRPGTALVARTKLSGGANPGVRLLPFVYSPTQSYVLEVGHIYVRVHCNGGTVEAAPGVPLELAAPWPDGELWELQWAQTGDVLTLTHPRYAPQELRRYGHTSWTLTPVGFARLYPVPHDIGTDPPVRTVGPKVTGAPFAGDADNPAREWQWLVTMLAQSPSGLVMETMPMGVPYWYDPAGSVDATTALPQTFAISGAHPVTLTRVVPTYGLPALPPEWAGYKAIAYNYYRGRGGLFGFVGQSTSRVFIDAGADPDYSTQPPTGANPFEVYDTVGHLERTERPAAVAFFRERRVFAGTLERPGSVWASASGDYLDFDVRYAFHIETEALTYELAARQREQIRSMLGASKLFVFTDASVWTVEAGLTEVDARVVDATGVATLPPLVVGQAVLFAKSLGQGVRALTASQANSATSYDARALSESARHLFSESPLRDWAYADEPWGLVWLVRQDGALLSLTYNGEAHPAWARHDTAGICRSVTSVPEYDEHAVYLVVERAGVTCIERMARRLTSGAGGGTGPAGLPVIPLDSAAAYDGPPATHLTGLSHLEGATVWARAERADVPAIGPLVVTGGAVDLPEPTPAGVTVWVGLAYTCELEALDIAQERLKAKSVIRVALELDESFTCEVGQDFEHLTRWRQRAVSDGYAPPSAATGLAVINVRGTWDAYGRAALRQSLPLPVTVLGLTRDVDVGG